MPERWEKITGFVLAGGASRRMGRAKQDLLFGGIPMLLRQCLLLGSVCSTVVVVGQGRAPLDGILACPDERGGCGPLGGICTGLARTRTEYNLFVGCDLPFMTRAFLRFLCGRALACEADVTAPESPDRRLQPLCAVYRRRARPAIRASLASGATKTSGFYPRVRGSVIPWPEISRAGFRPRIFTNVNTPEEYESACRELAAN